MNTPCYVLFAKAQPDAGLGAWSFTVQPLDGSPAWMASDVEPEVSGERLELLALVRALEALDQPGQVMVCCDSPRIERQLNQGFDDWRTAGWRWEAFGAMTPIPNADLWRRIDRAMHIHHVSCRRTPATLAPLAASAVSAPCFVPVSDVEPAAVPVIHVPAENTGAAFSPEPSVAPAAAVKSRVAADEPVAEPMTLPMSVEPLPPASPKKRRPRRPLRRRREAASWDQLVDHLRQGMARLRTVAATLA